ncbi:MAG: glutamyl-tRNA reductase [Gammaproteobacteria bacterium]
MIDFHVCGINYKTSSLTLREQVAITPEQQVAFLNTFKTATGADEVGVLMTCNRSEWYWSGGDHHEAHTWLAKHFNIPLSTWTAATYLHSRQEAVGHLMKVAAGLDSMMVGESQIFGQLKAAFQQMQQVNPVNQAAKIVFPVVFAAAKKVRNQTMLGARPTSIAYAAVNLARCIFSDFSALTLLLVGAGETIELAAKHFTKAGIKHMITANRTLEHAQQLAATWQGEAIALSQLSQHLARADIIVSATASPSPIITQANIALAMRQRCRPLYLIDLAMPRDIDADVGKIDGVYLYNLDHLQTIVDEAQVGREEAIKQAYHIIASELAEFTAKQKTREIVPEICDYRNKMTQMRDQEIQKALQQLRNGIPAEQVITRFANVLTNKFMHKPTVLLRALTETSD